MMIFEVTPPCKMPETATTYRSYLLRLWRAEKPGAPCRAMLESVTEPGERHYFKDIESLAAYLLAQQAEQPPEPEGGT